MALAVAIVHTFLRRPDEVPALIQRFFNGLRQGGGDQLAHPAADAVGAEAGRTRRQRGTQGMTGRLSHGGLPQGCGAG
jgi:hypothetical protein